jgi:AcrR family transcriptional regulator
VTVNGFPGTVGHMPAVPASDVVAPVENRRDRRTARTRQAILDAARDLIDEQGYSHTTVDQIAERADVAARTFFRHFASKEELLFADFEQHRRMMVTLIEAQPADVHPLRAALDGLAEFCDIVEGDQDQFMWAFRVMDAHGLHVEQAMLKAQTSDRIGAELARRLGVDPATDTRPNAWAHVALTLFGDAFKGAFGACGSGHPRRCFEALVVETARCFGSADTDPAT